MKRTLICAVGLLAVAGCAGSSSSASPTTLPALSSAPPTMAATTAPASAVPVVTKPPKADAPTQEGAAEFARYWYEELNAAYKTLQVAHLRTISTESCQACRNLTDSINASATARESYTGGTVSVREAVAAPLEAGRATVLVDYSAEALIVRATNGSVVDRLLRDHVPPCR